MYGRNQHNIVMQIRAIKMFLKRNEITRHSSVLCFKIHEAFSQCCSRQGDECAGGKCKGHSGRVFSCSPGARSSPSNAGSVGSIPSSGPKIPHASQPKNQNTKHKQYCNKFNKDLKKLFWVMGKGSKCLKGKNKGCRRRSENQRQGSAMKPARTTDTPAHT